MSTAAQEIALMKQRMESFEDKIDNLTDKLDLLTSQLLNPDNGFVVRVNKNTNRLDERDRNMGKWMKDVNDFHHMKKWKNGVNKALWVIYASIVAFVIKMLFWE